MHHPGNGPIAPVGASSAWPLESLHNPRLSGQAATRALPRWAAPRLAGGRVREVDARSIGACSGPGTIEFDAAWRFRSEARRESLVARLGPSAVAAAREFHVLSALVPRTPAPVPEPHWHEPDPRCIGAPFIVQDRLPADARVTPLTEAPEVLRAKGWRASLGMLVDVHDVDPLALGLGSLTSVAPDPTDAKLREWRERASAIPGAALLRAAVDWLSAHRPPPLPPESIDHKTAPTGPKHREEQLT